MAAFVLFSTAHEKAAFLDVSAPDTIDLVLALSDDDAASEAASSEPDTTHDQDPIRRQLIRRNSSALSLPLPLPLPLPLMQAHATVPLHSPAPLVGTPFDPRTSFEYPFPAPSAYHSPSPLWMQEGRTIPSPTPARPASAGPLSAPSYHHHPYSHLHSPLSWARPMPLPDRERATASASPTHTARAHHLPVPGQPQHPNLKLRARLMGRGVGEPPVPPGLVKRRRISEAAALEFEPVKTARSPSEGSILGAAVDGQR